MELVSFKHNIVDNFFNDEKNKTIKEKKIAEDVIVIFVRLFDT